MGMMGIVCMLNEVGTTCPVAAAAAATAAAAAASLPPLN